MKMPVEREFIPGAPVTDGEATRILILSYTARPLFL